MRAAYVYYRIQPEHTDAALQRVAGLMQAMQTFCGLPPRMMQRCDDSTTWMEIYEGIADWPAFARALERATSESGLASCLTGERHVECFLPYDTET